MVNVDIEKRVDEIFEEIVAIRRDFHSNPELSEHEVRTAQKISDYLSKWDIPHETGIAGNGVVAVIQGKGAPIEGQRFHTVGIRADIDALPINEAIDVPYHSLRPDVMHACGHDIHTAVLLGSAKILKEMESNLSGVVKFFFQPAEETIGGAWRMIQEGCMENPKVEVVVGLHVAPDIPVGCVEFCRGKMNAASAEFKIVVEGVECHGAHPNTGVDAILVAAHVICALQSIASRNVSPTNPVVVTVGQIHGGNKNNIIAKEATLSGIIRSLNMKTRDFLKERVEKIATNTGKAFGATARVEFVDSYPPLINDDKIESIFEEVASQYFPKENVLFTAEPSMGADDFSYFSQVAKIIYFNIGTLTEGETIPQMVHSEYFNPNEECIKAGILMEVVGTLELLK